MEKFDFGYNSSIKKIKCFYTFNVKTGENTFWEGYILTKNVDGILNLEGYEKDNMDSKEKNGEPHLRYILGNKAISYANESLIFEIYPGKIAPIHYDMHYNKEDGCFYGKWFFVPSNTHPHPHNLNGEAVIRIEDVMIEEKEVNDIIQQVAHKSKREYAVEMESFDFLAKHQFLLDDIDNSPAVKKLSKFSNIIKQK